MSAFRAPRGLARARRSLLLVASVLLILALGAVAAWGQLGTADAVDHTQRQDRQRLQTTLAGLTGQYLAFAFLDTSRAADATAWRLAPGDPADEAALRRAVTSSPLTSYGASLVSLAGAPLTSYAPRGVPSATDPGLRPLRAALLAGKPGLSDVLTVGTSSVVAFAVPVKRAGIPVAILVAFADVTTWPLQGYDASIRLGRTAEPYVLDADGTVAASGVVSAVGHRLGGLPGVVTAGGSGVRTFSRGGHDVVVSYAPAGYGWTALTVQRAADFSGGLRSRSRRDATALVVLLTLVVLLLLWFSWSRQQALRRLADEQLHDPLTGLALRRLFELRLRASVARQRRSAAPLTLLYGDLDGFKAVNDTYGHNAGDQLLVAVGERMRQAVRDEDLVARVGGDEFAVVLEGTDVAEAVAVAQRLRQDVGAELSLGGAVVRPHISVGVAVLRDPARADDLLAEADLAMYRVKHADGDGVVVLDEVGALGRGTTLGADDWKPAR